jgi:heme O synthase-like polyprenyltransferase
MSFVFFLLFFIAIFINHDFAVVIAMAINAGKIYFAWKGRKSDRIEWHKTLVVSGIGIAICIALFFI